MTSVQSVPGTPGATPQKPAEPSATKEVAAGTDFETFLSLLTAQMRNQDPLKPLDSTEFVAQLASFSTVEQQIRSNDRLDAILDALTGGGGSGLAQWIGKEVRSDAPARFEGEPVDIWTTPVAEAKRAVLVVTDAQGQEVARLAADPGAERLVWAGETATGGAPSGSYRFKVDYLSEDESLGTVDGTTFSQVKELRLGGEDGPRLVLEGGADIDAEDVAAVREPAV